MIIGQIGAEKRGRESGQNPNISARWWISNDGLVGSGWPEPGSEASCLAVGWISTEAAVGVIEFSSAPVDDQVLNMLEVRFPGRRWFIGTRGGDPVQSARRIAA